MIVSLTLEMGKYHQRSLEPERFVHRSCVHEHVCLAVLNQAQAAAGAISSPAEDTQLAAESRSDTEVLAALFLRAAPSIQWSVSCAQETRCSPAAFFPANNTTHCKNHGDAGEER